MRTDLNVKCRKSSLPVDIIVIYYISVVGVMDVEPSVLRKTENLTTLFCFGIRRFAREKLRKEELRKAAAQAERDIVRSKYPKGVIINESAISSQPIAKYQVLRLCCC